MDQLVKFVKSVDFGRVAETYALYLAGYPDRLFEVISTNYGVGKPGQRVLDLGTGPGTVASKISALGAQVTGLDPSAEMLAIARQKTSSTDVKLVEGYAEDLHFAQGTFDCVIAGQAWHLFDRDRAAEEAFRVLADGGKLIITHFEWITSPGGVADLTESVIYKHNPTFALGGYGGIYVDWLPTLTDAGFVDAETFSFEAPLHFTHEQWRLRILTSAAGRASLDEREASSLDRELAEELARSFSGGTLTVPHRSWTVVVRKSL